MFPSPRLEASQLGSVPRLRGLTLQGQFIRFLIREFPETDFDQSHSSENDAHRSPAERGSSCSSGSLGHQVASVR